MTGRDMAKGEHVILLHGLGRSRWSMTGLERYLKKQGYIPCNAGYPSTREPIERLASVHLHRAVKKCLKTRASRIHCVTHSLGGLLVRQYLQNHNLPPGSRMVMLSPPNRGTEITDRLKNFFLYRWVTGPAGQELGTGPDHLPGRLQPIGMEVGILTGNRSLNPVFSALIPGANDGIVAVDNTRMEGMTDFLVLPYSHTFIMLKPSVWRQVDHFLCHGRFERDGHV